MNRDDARRLRQIVRRALESADAKAWRSFYYPMAKRWDDGSCEAVARTIATFDRHRGEVVSTHRGYHFMYRIGNWLIDGHRIYPWNGEIESDKPLFHTSYTILRLMREAAAKEKATT